MKKKIDQFNVGDKAEFKHTISEEDVRKFVQITGDDNPLHTDPAFAKKTTMKTVVAHGMLSASFISTLIGKYIPGEGALWVSQNLNFLLPVRIGDELTFYAEVLKKQEKLSILTLKTEVKNQYKQVVVSGEAQVKILDTEEPEAVNVAVPMKKVVLITGASRGIGAATALRLAKQGFSVAVNYRKDKAGAQEVIEEIQKNDGQAMLYQADITDENAVKNMVSDIIRRFGTITALVNNATSRIVPQDFPTLAWNDIQSHIDIQIKGSFNCIVTVLNEFLKNNAGNIVNIGSIYSDTTPPSKLIGYTLAKNALQSLTRSLAVEFGHRGIRCNMVSPGMTDTSLISDVPEKTRLTTIMQTPLRKLAHPDDIAAAIAFLLSDDAKHITGETLRVCGGMVMI